MKKRSFLSGILIAVLFAELMLRFIGYNPPEINKKYYWNGTLWLLQNVKLNSAGYRDYEHAIDNPNNNFRIYAIGNSYTFGWFIDKLEDTYPKLIEEKLNNISTRKVEVINSAMWGFRIKQEYERFMWEGRKYRPDVVLLGLMPYEGNVSNTYFRPADIFLPDFIRNSKVYYFVVGQHLQKWADKKNHEYYASVYRDLKSPEWRNFESYISKLNSEAKKIGSHFAILVFPYIHEKNPNIPYDFYEYHKRLAELGKKYNISVIDPIDEVLKVKDKGSLVLNPTDAHPTIRLNKIVADAFVEQFNMDKFIKQEKKTPNISTVFISSSKSKINKYNQIFNISSETIEKPFLYNENQDNSFQELPVPKISDQGSYIFPDKLITKSNQEPQLIHYIYSHDGYTLNIPRTLYGFNIVGINQIDALNILKPGGIPVSKYNVKKNTQSYEIVLKNPVKNVIFKLHLAIDAGQVTLNEDNSVYVTNPSFIRSTQKMDSNLVDLPLKNKKLAFFPHFVDKSKTLISILKEKIGLLESITNLGIFSLTDKSGKLKPIAQNLIGKKNTNYKTYAYINGIQTQVKSFEIKDESVSLQFYKKINKGQQIEIPVWFEYDYEKFGRLNIEIEN